MKGALVVAGGLLLSLQALAGCAGGSADPKGAQAVVILTSAETKPYREAIARSQGAAIRFEFADEQMIGVEVGCERGAVGEGERVMLVLVAELRGVGQSDGYQITVAVVFREANAPAILDGNEVATLLDLARRNPGRSGKAERWVNERRAKTEELSGGRIGYLHIKAMDQTSLRRFEKELRENRHKEALVIDQRFNGGGNIEQELLAILVQRPYQVWQPRHTDPTDCAARTGDRDGGLHGLFGADTLKDRMHAKATGQCSHALGCFLATLAHDIRRAECLRQSDTVGMATEDDDLFRAQPLCSDDAAQTHRAITDDRELSDEVVKLLRARHEIRANQLPNSLDPSAHDTTVAGTALTRELIAAERRFIHVLLRNGKITDETRRRIERDLDLEEASLSNREYRKITL